MLRISQNRSGEKAICTYPWYMVSWCKAEVLWPDVVAIIGTLHLSLSIIP